MNHAHRALRAVARLWTSSVLRCCTPGEVDSDDASDTDLADDVDSSNDDADDDEEAAAAAAVPQISNRKQQRQQQQQGSTLAEQKG